MFKIITKPDFLFSKVSNTYSCTFYCLTERGAFPHEEWTDFPYNILEWWIDKAIAIRYTKKSCEKFCFEDGPYWIKSAKENDNMELQFCTANEIRIIPDITLSFRDFTNELYKAALHLKSSLYMGGYIVQAAEVDSLIEKIQRLM